VKYVIFDTETGGLDAATDALISLGAVVWDSERGRIPEPEFYATMSDRIGITYSAALKVNGFTREQINAFPAPAEAWSGFVAFCQGQFARGAQVLLGGHNTGFDVSFLKRLARVSGNADRFEAIFSHRTVCTMNTVRFLALAGVLRPGLGGLGQCVEELGVPKQEAHNALGDARMAADLLTALVGRVVTFGASTIQVKAASA
jgi:DNA polymerase-3 subunit epsilon